MIPNRISIVTYNLWNTKQWPEREPALREFLDRFTPDILCVQELRPQTLTCIDDALASHDHVADDAPGWSCESNIFWNASHFEKIAHGLESLKMLDDEEYRGFFWVRLKLKGSDRTIFVSTAHFTYQGNPEEIATGLTLRNRQMRQSIDYLNALVQDDEPAFFMGDFNDPVIPYIMMRGTDYQSCFKELGMLCPATYPAMPTANYIEENQTIDWMFCNGKARPLAASVPQLFYAGTAPSDHWPIQAIYQLESIEGR